MARALVTMPKTAKRGEVIEIRTLIAHPMETGYRPGEDGAIVPRNLIRQLICHYDDVVVFSAELYPAVAANPLITFCTVAVAQMSDGTCWSHAVDVIVTLAACVEP